MSRTFTGFIIFSFHMYICHKFNEFVGFIGFEVIQLWEANFHKLRQSFMYSSVVARLSTYVKNL